MSPYHNLGSICTTEQCAQGRANKTALRWIDVNFERTDYTFANLAAYSNQFAHALKTLNIAPGTVVAQYLPKTPEQFFSALGILKHRAVVLSLFSSFGKTALQDRLADSNAHVLITKKAMYQRIKAVCDELPDLQIVILIDIPEHQSDTVLSYSQCAASQPTTYEVLPTSPETPSILYYTSGSTGKPKGVQHVHGSLAHLRLTFRSVFQSEPGDLYWCTADQAWVTGMSYGLIAPWSEGATQLHYAGTFNVANWFRILEEEQVSIWYTAPTALRMIMQQEDQIGKRDLSALKRIYSVGEPLNPEIIHWGRVRFGCEIYDTWFQTETGGIMIGNRPNLPVKVGSMGKLVETIQASVRTDDFAAAVATDQIGKLCLHNGWSSMFTEYRHMLDAYQAKFHEDWYYTGDLARQDDDGYFWFVGRGDDVINTSGHLVGPFEVESALLEIPQIADTAVIGAPDPLLHEKVVAFVVLKANAAWSHHVELQCRIHVSNRVSPLAVPIEYVIIDNIPKNRSGKIMRRVLKAHYLHEDTGDTSTLEEA